MKRIVLLLLIGLVALSCKKDADNDVTYNFMTVSPDWIERVGSNGGEFTLQIKSTGFWVVDQDYGEWEWYSMSRYEGSGSGSVILTVKKNEKAAERNAIVKFRDAFDIEHTVYFKQNASDL